MNLVFYPLVDGYEVQTPMIYDVFQYNMNNEIIGGEQYQLLPNESRDDFEAYGGADQEILINDSVSLTATDIYEPATYNWYTSEGGYLSSGKEIMVSPNQTSTYKLEVIANVNKFKDYDEVNVKVKKYFLKKIHPNPASNQITLKYNIQGANTSYITIKNTSNINTNYNNYILT